MSITTKSLDKSPENVSVATDRTQSSTAAPVEPPVIIYTPKWTEKRFMKHVLTKVSRNNGKTSIVDRFTAEQTSDWSSTRSESDGRQSGEKSFSEKGSPLFSYASTVGFQPEDTPSSNSISLQSAYPSSEDRGPPKVRLRKSTTLFRDHRSFYSSRLFSNETNDTSSSVETEPFYQEVRTCSSPESFNKSTKYRTFEHRFHWSENTENRSPWVRQRTKEITDYVNGLFEMQELEVSGKNSEDGCQEDSKIEIAREDNGEIDDDNDGITYEMASAFCDLFVGPDNVDTSKNQCSSLSDGLKWTRLYKKLVNYGQL